MNLKYVVYDPTVNPELTEMIEVDSFILFKGDNMFSELTLQILEDKPRYKELVDIGAIVVKDYSVQSKTTASEKKK